MTTPGVTPQQVLDLPLPDTGVATVRGYLVALLAKLWREGERFSSKRPFGFSSWQYDLFAPLIRAGIIDGSFDEDGGLEECDDEAGYRLIATAIESLGEPPGRAPLVTGPFS